MGSAGDKRVVVTGIGVVSPLGIGVAELGEALREGRSGIRRITGFDTSAYRSKTAGSLVDFEPREYIPPMRVRRMGQACKMTVAAGRLAIQDGGLDLDRADLSDLGISIGTGGAGTESTYRFFQGLVKSGPQATNPMLFPTTVTNAPAGMLGIEVGAAGPNTTFAQRGDAAEAAIVCAARWIRQGRARYVLAGGVDEVNEAYFRGHALFGVLSPGRSGSDEGMRPFDRSRNGFVLSEGSTVLLIESAQSARRRSARIYGEVAGWGEAAEIGHILDYPASEGAIARAMTGALESAGATPEGIGWVNASANSSRRLDPLEATAIHKVFSHRKRAVPTSSVKSYFGDGQASGALRAAASLLALQEGVIPPTLHLQEPIREGGLDHVRGSARRCPDLRAVLQDGVADGGGSMAVVFRRV